jgi:hypothetical protein
MKRLFILLIICRLCIPAYGQNTSAYRAESFASTASGAHTPFWTVNHTWGVTALEANNFHLRGALFHEQTLNKDWAFDAGIDIVAGNHSSYGAAWLQQLYIRLKWKALRLDIGSAEDYLSFLNPQLSSGDFIHSNNARPIPQIRGSLPDFILIPHTQGNMYVKADFSIGRYMDGDWQSERAHATAHNYTRNVLSHSKSLYFRWGNTEKGNRQQFIFGLAHKAKWGGILVQEHASQPSVLVSFHQPADLDAFLRMVIAKEGTSQSSLTDQAFVSGSHWGAYLFKYEYQLKNKQSIHAYIQHLFEDGTGMVFQNNPDNLYGLEWRSPRKTWLSGVIFEFIYTKRQTGPIHLGDILGHDQNLGNIIKGGNDNYYNNVDYVQGPSNFGKSEGTPLFLSPEYNTDGAVNFKGSRIQAFHWGVDGYLCPALQYRLLLTVGKNWGRYYLPFTYVHKGLASHVEFLYTFPKDETWQLRFQTGYDNGDSFGGKTLGAGITLIKRGILPIGNERRAPNS